MATNPFRQLDVIRNASQKGNTITDCYRLMYNKKLWITAYAKLYPNPENLTKTTANETIDGFSLQRIDDIIERLKAGTFRFASVRAVYPPKSNGKKRPLRTSNVNDKLVQEVMRMVLENVYEPIFSTNSHGFREGRSCHTALSQIRNTWKGLTWCIKGNTKGFFDHIDHTVLLKLISKKINDRRFLLLIHNALTSGVMEGWTYYKTCSGTPQGGIISPILANIYLHEFDLFMEKQMKEFDKGKVRASHEEDLKIRSAISTLSQKIKRLDGRNRNSHWQGREELVLTIQELKAKQVKVHSADPIDKNYQRMKYVRYADDFVIGMAGSKQSAVKMKETSRYFLEKELRLELSGQKIIVTHLENSIPFLGYEFYLWSERRVKRDSYKNQKHLLKKRTLSGAIKLEIPEKKIRVFASKNGYGNVDNFKIMHRAKLLNNSELEILHTYNTELRGIANYYKLADNYHYLGKLFYLAESSFIKTIANKRKSTSRKVANSMRTHKQGGVCLVRRDQHGNEKPHPFLKLKDLPKHKGAVKADSPDIDILVNAMKYSGGMECEQRLLANQCEVCGTTEGQMEAHPVGKLKT
ncbi:reverse transcriptase/maturase family protein [Bacillus badius]|uniref:Retron-type RNA-directed DNA polymerase n=1 Tax=Bacillus badius TaxID=1455 RepID=A0ABR5AT81_BACBA|nr:reverse transcriptase/maturase family protein [Bacillus badius]KIL75481.1 Retron-type RNA-directed DNA polymerase [Bacillus badius]KIL77957.1 Retron-type RNA-directed DNA polymerase [Bacillus badius]MED4716391.1 reverse transcriptase domain-containing protein [Bacillus badius]